MQLQFLQFLILVTVTIIPFISCQIPCDDEYGANCPEESGWAVGECLRKTEVSAACSSFIEMHDACKDDIEKHCIGKEYTGDLLVCLSEWTKPADLSEGCLNVLPKKEEKKKRELTPEEKAKADARRKARKKAAKYAREL